MTRRLYVPQPEVMPTTWPITWGRNLRSGADLARQNALTAARVVHERKMAALEAAELALEEQLFLLTVRQGYGDDPLPE
jgi:hypothetical protein